jgi:hypothetical protein
MLALIALIACDGGDTGPSYTKDSDDGYVPWPDSGDTGLDEDGDGWTVQGGDCDDADVYVNPGWEESDQEGNHEDGKDNDCDGTTDETFRGLVVLQSGPRDGSDKARVVKVDSFGESVSEVVFDDINVQNIQYQDMSGTWIDLTFEFAPGVYEGWAVIGQDRESRDQYMVSVSETGETSLLASFSDTDTFPAPGYGLDVHPDGFYLVAGLYYLYKIDPSGNAEIVADFFDTDGETPLMLAFDLAVDPVTGQVMVVGYYGGAVLLDPETWEKTWVVQPDLSAPTHNMWSAAFWDTRGGWYAGGQDASGWGVFRLNEADGAWVTKASFDESWTPHKMAIDTVYGEYFMSAYGGQYPVVWELDAETGSAPAQFFASEHSGVSWMDMWDLYVRY